MAEVLIWVNYEDRARYQGALRFDINADMLATYQELRDKGSTKLQLIPVVGAPSLESKRISETEYMMLKR